MNAATAGMRAAAAGSGYTGRFAPSPTGPLHAGSLVAALASWLDARAHGGRWLVRIEDVDSPRCVPGAAETMLGQLAACGLLPDAAPVWQSQRSALYAAALHTLQQRGWAYACSCTRRDIDLALAAAGQPHQRFGERVYPGTCRDGQQRSHQRAAQPKPALAMRALTLQAGNSIQIDWQDRRLGAQQQNLSTEVGDFVLQRADGLWAYQLAVVVDDAAQHISNVVRGADLADNTARQIHLQRLLGLPTPHYLHSPLVLGADGHKLSKQNGAQALDLHKPLAALMAAADALGLHLPAASTLADWLAAAVAAWGQRWPLLGSTPSDHTAPGNTVA